MAGPSQTGARALAWLLAGLAVTVAAGCSEPGDDRVEVVDGTLPPTTTSSPTTAPATTGPPGDTTTSLGPPTLDDTSPVSTAGVGEVDFGLTRAEAEQAAGSRLVALDGQDPAGPCWRGALESGPLGLTFTVVDGVVQRLDVDDGPLATVSGAGIGDTADQLRELFGERLEEGPDPDGSGTTLTYVPQDASDAGTRIIFSVEAEVVTSLRAGQLPVVATGC